MSNLTLLGSASLLLDADGFAPTTPFRCRLRTHHPVPRRRWHQPYSLLGAPSSHSATHHLRQIQDRRCRFDGQIVLSTSSPCRHHVPHASFAVVGHQQRRGREGTAAGQRQACLAAARICRRRPPSPYVVAATERWRQIYDRRSSGMPQ